MEISVLTLWGTIEKENKPEQLSLFGNVGA